MSIVVHWTVLTDSRTSLSTSRKRSAHPILFSSFASLTISQFDSRKGATWHCVVGRNFGSFVTHGELFDWDESYSERLLTVPSNLQRRNTSSISTSGTAPSSSSRRNRTTPTTQIQILFARSDDVVSGLRR